MKKYNKKSIILPVLAAASLGMSSLALADTNNQNNQNTQTTFAAAVPPAGGGGVDTAQITGAIKDLGKKMVALGFAGMTAFDQAMYQFDQNLANSLVANASATSVDSTVANNTANLTSNYIQTTMQGIPDSFLSTAEDAINSEQIQQNIKTQNAMINNLTLGVPASDTLYINNPTTIAAGFGSLNPSISNYYNSTKSYTIGPPPVNDENYFSISSIIQPDAYSSTEENAANAYMAYLTQSYNSPATGLKLSDLKGYINSLKPSKQSQTLYKFLSSSQYQQYQLAMRSYMANKSIGINNFEHLIAERTPSKTAVQGIYDSKGNPITNPSPLQVENYQANHRIDNAAWIQSLQTMSSSSLQREIAVELAVMIKQNQQAHLDRERILTTMSALQLASSQGSQMALNTMAQQVNDEISNLTGQGSSSNGKGDSSSNAQQQAKEDSKKQQEEAKKQQQQAEQEAKKKQQNS